MHFCGFTYIYESWTRIENASQDQAMAKTQTTVIIGSHSSPCAIGLAQKMTLLLRRLNILKHRKVINGRTHHDLRQAIDHVLHDVSSYDDHERKCRFNICL